MNQTALLTPFVDTTTQSQQVFRQLLKAMSEPGTIIDLSDFASINTNTFLYPTIWSIVQSLLDSETTVYLSPALAKPEAIQSIQFYTDAGVVDDAKQSGFAMISVEEFTSIADFNCGTVITPHISTTLLIQVDDIVEQGEVADSDISLKLTGPGIRDSHLMSVAGLQPFHCELLKSNHGLYPCGLDIIFCSPTKISAVARSTSITWENG